MSVDLNEKPLNFGSPLSDRDMMFALFDMVSALAEKITGERMIVGIEAESGFLNIRTSPGSVIWKSPNMPD